MSNTTTDTDRIRHVFIPPSLHEAAKEYASRNGMSVSEVVRDAMTSFTTGVYPPDRERLKRVTIWMDPADYAAFTAKARESNITIRRALELSLGELL